jgi:hypothetical protein
MERTAEHRILHPHMTESETTSTARRTDCGARRRDRRARRGDRRARRGGRVATSAIAAGLTALWVVAALATSWRAAPLAAQEIDDPAALAGVPAVALRATAVWDEEITTSAGGATGAQFEEALLSGLRTAIDEADPGPLIDPGAAGSLLCHVDTFYDRGLIVYAVRVSYHRPDADGIPVIAWLESSVGSYTAEQLHVIWTLADQCADAFLEDWRAANPG